MKGVGIYANYLLVIFCCHGCGACRKTSFRLKIFRFCANTCQKFLKIYLYSSNFLTSSRTKSEDFATKAGFPTCSSVARQNKIVPLTARRFKCQVDFFPKHSRTKSKCAGISLSRRSHKILFCVTRGIFLKPFDWRFLLPFCNLANSLSLKSGLLLTPFDLFELFLSRVLPRLDQMPNLKRRIAHCSSPSISI